jgi:hypothetical protein
MTYSSWHHGHLTLADWMGRRRVRNVRRRDRVVTALTNPTAGDVRAVPFGTKLS